MSDFRKITPARRESVPVYKTHNEYKPLLREDFHQRCGYCGDHEFFRDTYYEVDHFVPKKSLVNISPTEYSNLVYSCRSCNNSKRAKWPTRDQNIHNHGKLRYIDPSEDADAAQFERLADGSIHSITDLGDWMWSALNFGNPAHRVRWKLEEIKIMLKELDKVNIDSLEELRAKEKLNRLYHNLEEQLKGKPKFD